MTREPLMLSDTAMVLLREYIEAQTASLLLAMETKDSMGIDLHNMLMVFGVLHDYQRSLEKALLDELWCLLKLKDIPLIRHLDWHVSLDEHLLKEAESVITPPWIPNPERTLPLPDGHTSMYISLMPMMRASFLITLVDAYHKALETYNTSVSDSKP